MANCWCDYVPSKFYSAAIRKARKEHECEECGRAIARGEKYEYVSGMWEDYIDTYKTCLGCVELKKLVKQFVPCFCWHHRTLHDDAKETADYYRGECPELLVRVRWMVRKLERSARKKSHEIPKLLSPPTQKG